MAISGATKKKTKLRLVRSPGSLKLKLVPISSPPPPSDHLPIQSTPADSTATSRPRIVFKLRIPPQQEKEKEKQLSSPRPAAMKKKKRSAADSHEEKHGKRQRRLDSGCCDSSEELSTFYKRLTPLNDIPKRAEQLLVQPLPPSKGRTALFYRKTDSRSIPRGWISGLLALPAAAYMLQEQEVHAAEFERTFIAIKPDGVQRGLIAEIMSRFESKGFKLVGVKLVVPSKDFAGKHYHDLKGRPFFNGLCDFLSSGPVLAMVWEGEGVIKYGRKLIGATDPQKSEPGTIRGDLAVVVGRNIIHGSDGPETAKSEINLWFKPEELVSYKSNSEKWIYGVN